jgi:hypothetical protein
MIRNVPLSIELTCSIALALSFATLPNPTPSQPSDSARVEAEGVRHDPRGNEWEACSGRSFSLFASRQASSPWLDLSSRSLSTWLPFAASTAKQAGHNCGSCMERCSL